MKRPELRDLSRELVEERESRRQMTVAQRERDDITRDAPLASAQRRTDPEGTARYLVKIAMRLQDGERLRGDVRNWLGHALIEIALNPTKAASELGLVRAANRPSADLRTLMYALGHVTKLRGDGVKPLTQAFKRAAKKSGLSASLIAREWWAYRRYERSVRSDIK